MKRRTRLRSRKGLSRTLPLRAYGDTDQAGTEAQRPLQALARARLTRTSPLPQQSARQKRRRARWSTARMVPYDRSGGWCEVCGRAIARDAFEAHHRKLRSQGGTDEPQNLLACCPGPAGCHIARIHGGDRADVEARGWIVRREGDPAATPALIAGQRGMVLLTATGYVPVLRAS